MNAAAGGREAPPLFRRNGSEAPASFAQRRLWLLDRMGAAAAYNVTTALRLRGALDTRALEQALAAIVQRHEVLRTCLPAAAGGPVQRLLANGQLPLTPVDLTAVPQAPNAAAAFVLQEAKRPFDLEHGPLVRAALATLGPDEHALVVTAHHAVWDRWSTGVFFAELSSLYADFAARRPVALPPLPLQYGDFAAWQLEHLSGSVLERALAAWRERLTGLEPLELPADRPRPVVQGYASAVHDFAIPDALVPAVRALARGARTTPAAVLLAVWQILLGRYAAASVFAVGMPVANRGRVELESLIGVFVNTLVVRSDLTEDPRFADQLLPRVREAMLGALEHGELPFEQLVEALRPPRDPSRHPLFQVLFSMQHRRRETLRLGDIEVLPLSGAPDSPELAPVEAIQTQFDLELRIVEHAESLHGRLVWDTDLFDRPRLERMARHFVHLLANVIDTPHARLSQLALTDAEERNRILVFGRVGEPPPPELGCLHECFSAQAARTPAATAVIERGRATSFADLEARAESLASALRAHGAGPGQVVGVALERSSEAIAALLGVLKTGAAWLPLDPHHPAQRLAWIFEDAAPAVVVTHTALRSRLPQHDRPTLCIDRPLAAPALAPPAARGDAPRIASLIYTSGSTGRPKGVLGTHRGAVNRIRWGHAAAPWMPGEVAVHKTDLGFVDALAEILSPLCAGIAVLVLDEATVRDPRALVATLAQHRVTRLVLVPALLEALLETVPDLGARVPSLRWWTSSGERLTRRLAARLHAAAPQAVLWNIYGSTEVTADATWFEAPRNADLPADQPGDVPIGRPLDGVHGVVLDTAGQLAPLGVPGELCVGGVGVAHGYHGQPAATAAAFVPDPFVASPGARLYRTGDRARWREDGVLEYLGRLDRQVKVRGVRVEPGEVEATLLAHPGVAGVAVVAGTDVHLGTQLHAYVVAAEPAPSPTELLTFVRERLPAPMVPTTCMLLTSLPRTPSGKVDRAALPTPAAAGPATDDPPRDGIEEVLVALFGDVLGTKAVGVHDDFFALGGHSLAAVRLAGRVRETLQTELAPRELFVHPSVARLAALLRRGGAAPAGPLLVRAAAVDKARLSFAQERLWFLDRMGAGAVFHLPLALRLRGDLDIAALELALVELVRRHAVLRSGFTVEDGVGVQRIMANANPTLGRSDLRPLAPEARDTAWARAGVQEAEAPFDLATPPLLRARLFTLGDREHVLQVTVHHAASDGWSNGLLLDELGQLYSAYANGQPSPLAELPLRYLDFALWQRARLSGSHLEELVARARARFAGLTPLELPVDRPRPALQQYRSAVHDFDLPTELASELAALGRAHGATLAMVLLAAWQALLARLAAQLDIAVGMPVAGREHQGLERLVGCFVNTVVVRVSLAGDPRFASELLPRVRDAALEAYALAELGFEKLVLALDPPRDASRHPLYQASFTLQNAPRVAPTFAGLTAEELRLPSAGTTVDLDLRVLQHGAGSAARLVYDAALFEPATAARCAERWLRLLRGIVRDPEVRLADLPLADAEERASELAAWNATACDLTPTPVFERILAQAREHRERVAVESDRGRLTYGELASRIEGLAQHLVAAGVVKEDLVGVALDRSLDLVPVLLAIHAAGAAWLPLEPDLPPARRDQLVADARPKLVIVKGSAYQLESAGTQVLRLDAAAFTAPAGVTLPAVAPTQLAYAIYTSGSTGKPKGVLVEHGSLTNVVTAMQRAVGFADHDVLLAITPLGFDIAALELLLPLVAGGRVVLASRATAADPRALAAAMERSGATIMQATPTTWRMLVAAGWRPPRPIRALCGGEALAAELAHALLALPGLTLWNLYGPTETTIWSTVEPVRDAHGPITIGKPIANTRLYVLDPRLEPAPIGVPGELWIAGRGVARGYLDRPEQTAARFRTDPFAAPGERMHRTGDRARRLADGRVSWLGRLDDQVKLRGHRIELGEVEAALGRHPAVRETAVALRTLESGEPALVAFVVAAQGSAPPTPHALLAFLADQLPAPLLPARLHLLEALPRNANGKVDRAALPAAPPVDPTDFEPPDGAIETALATIWRSTLGLTPQQRIGRSDTFADLGGHSLLAVAALALIERQLGVVLRPQELLFASLAQAAATCASRAGVKTRRGVLARLAAFGRRVWTRPR